MKENKKVLLIGRSGRGKSTLANVITKTNNFKESSSSTSETKKIQFEWFEFDSKKKLKKLSEKLTQKEKIISEQSSLNEEDLLLLQEILQGYIQSKEETEYCVIDTPGIGDTKLTQNEVLDIIAEAVYLVRDGVNQVFFVVNGRFDQSEMATYNLLRTIIFDQSITDHTTIIRTNFTDFKSKKKCEVDTKLMIEGAKGKKTALKNSITTKKINLENLSSDGDNYRQLLVKEVEELEKELIVTNLVEIIESCQGRFVYVDNPPLEISGAEEEELQSNQKKRDKSREILLTHLQNNCQEVPYKPQKLQELSTEIADDYFQYTSKKKELEEELEKLKIKHDKDIFIESKQKYLMSEEKQVGNDKINIKSELIITKQQIKQLEDKKIKLRKEIDEKEQLIRQKVLKHVFNNYDEIDNAQGGNIFLNSITEDNNNWLGISQEFADKKLILEWRINSFTYQQVNNWALVLGSTFNPHYDTGFCSWLRDDKKLIVEIIHELTHPYNITQLRTEYHHHLQQVNKLLDHHNRQLISHEVISLVQQWLNNEYPISKRNEITSLDISNKKLSGVLKMEMFSNLNRVDCYYNKLTNLDLSNCSSLVTLHCYYNKLTNLDLSNCSSLTWVECNYNQLTDLTIFSKLENCKRLRLENNPLTGSLSALQNLLQLEWLNIENTNLTEGLEYLPASLEEIDCNGKLAEQLTDYKIGYNNQYNYQDWRKDHLDLVNSVQSHIEVPSK